MDITHLQSNDIIVAYVGIGTMPPGKAKSFVAGIKSSLSEKFANKLILLADRSDNSVKLEIIRPV